MDAILPNLKKETITTAVSEMAEKLGIKGSVWSSLPENCYDLYRLVEVYLIDGDARQEINMIVRSSSKVRG